jgi:hypothetical protein
METRTTLAGWGQKTWQPLGLRTRSTQAAQVQILLPRQLQPWQPRPSSSKMWMPPTPLLFSATPVRYEYQSSINTENHANPISATACLFLYCIKLNLLHAARDHPSSGSLFHFCAKHRNSCRNSLQLGFLFPPLSFELERFNMHGDVMIVVDHARSLTRTRHHVCSFSPSRILVVENTLTASL